MSAELPVLSQAVDIFLLKKGASEMQAPEDDPGAQGLGDYDEDDDE